MPTLPALTALAATQVSKRRLSSVAQSAQQLTLEFLSPKRAQNIAICLKLVSSAMSFEHIANEVRVGCCAAAGARCAPTLSLPRPRLTVGLSLARPGRHSQHHVQPLTR